MPPSGSALPGSGAEPQSLSRRSALGLIASAAAALPLSAQGRSASPNRYSTYRLSAADSLLLDELERTGCLFFTEQVGVGGQVLDRAVNRPAVATAGTRDRRTLSSVAATGYGLGVLCIAAERGFLPREDALAQVRSTLDFHLNRLPHQHGFFTHFNNANTGIPVPGVEVSSIDTAILLCGVLTVRQYFRDPAIRDMATALYNRVDWPWMLNGGTTLSMGWHSADGFLQSRWSHFCELMMMYLLAIGSPTHPISATAWDAFSRPRVQYAGFNYISGNDPIFTHQYSHAWFDFRNRHDRYTDYFANSVTATRAHRQFCLDLHNGYTEDQWGVSASDSRTGYRAWGGPPLQGPVDGTLVPYATAGCLPFLPEECLRVQRHLRLTYSDRAWGRYGLCDAFHPANTAADRPSAARQTAARPTAAWYDPDVLGIDLGIGILMAENLRSGLIWHLFMQNEEARRAMQLCGFRSNS